MKFRTYSLLVIGVAATVVGMGFLLTARTAYYSGLVTAAEVELLRASGKWRSQRSQQGASEAAPIPSGNVRMVARYGDLDSRLRELFSESELRPGRTYRFELPPSSSSAGGNAFLMRVTDDAGDFYVVLEPEANPPERWTMLRRERLLGAAAPLFFGVALCGGLLYLMLDRGSRRLLALSQWAGSLRGAEGGREPPDFGFQEVNKLARALQSSVEAVAESGRRERAFSRFASHELRSPLAVISANIDILELSASGSGPNGAAALRRMRRAVEHMTNLTQSLLWLAKSETGLPSPEPVDLLEVCRDLVAENDYLAQGRPVQVDIAGDEQAVMVPRTFCEIVLRNLVRNALQYTESGTIRIAVQGDSVAVLNPVDFAPPSAARNRAQPDEHGFGIGMLLVETIAERLGWKLEVLDDAQWHSVTVRFRPLT